MRAGPLMGGVKISTNSSLRKLARAMRRGKVPPERQNIIEHATVSAHKRYKVYQNRKRNVEQN